MKVGWFVRGDIDGFFGLFVDNLLQLMLIAVLCGNGVQNKFGFGAAKAYALVYLIAALLLVALHYYNRGRESESTGIIA